MTGLDYAAAFTEAFTQAREKEARFTSVPESDWHRSGRASRQWPDKEGEEFWLEQGPLMLERYAEWRREFAIPIWTTPDGEPAIELDITTDSLSTVKGAPADLPALRAIIDRIFVDPDTGELIIVDLKTGKVMPKRQLGFYKVAVEMRYPGIHITKGAWWKARDAAMTDLVDLSYWTPAKVVEIVAAYEAHRKSHLWPPAPNMMCSSCPVRRYCAEQGGDMADEIPPF